jgi:hypothetical protein
MTPETPQETTSLKIAGLATTKARLPRLALIGIFGNAEAPAALLRKRSGTTTSVIPGDQVGKYTVAAITTDHIILKLGSKTDVLRLPDA